jgi:hypothetical protein
MERKADLKNSMFQKAYRGAYRRALKKGLPFDLLVADLKKAYDKQNGNCFYSGIHMHVCKVKEKKELHDPYKMTLDCLDPLKGYTSDNIVWCLYCVNSFKQRMQKKEMMQICLKMLENQLVK